MDTDRNLLFGALTVQADLVDDGQLTEACTAWSAGEAETLADVMVNRGLITHDDRAAVERVLDRKVERRGGDVAGTLAATLGGPARPGATQADDGATNETQPMAAAPGGHVVLSAIGASPTTAERYTRTRLHATGGIGRVWLARDASFGREVALKEIRPERGANELIWSRFLEEARITGQLEHPGIVPVYELGTGDADSGPFYTMRFVKGRTLAEAAHDYHKARAAGTATPLDFVTLLNAFVGVCNALAYAHSRGVIHRDLKGQNIVLGDFGEVIVLDWGLAKIIGAPDAVADGLATLPDGGNPRFQTLAGRALGTPAYMPPEQAAGRLDEVDRRSDVYGLGAILYEILTGRAPFDGSITADILRRVIEEEPPPPHAVVPATPRPLEAVCLKAMAKHQADRYASAADLADDVRRWVADEPVSAFPEPWIRRFGRWAKRHRTAVSAAAALLVTATVALSVSAALIRRERDEARAQRNEARAQRQVARTAVDEMYTEVAEKWLEDNLDPIQKEFLEKALAYYETFAGQADAEPTVRQERGRAYKRMGDILHKLGRNPEAVKAFRRAGEVLGALSDDFPEEPEPRHHLAAARAGLGVLLAERGDNAEAEDLFRKALAALEPLASAPDAPAASRLDLAKAHKGLADLLRVQSKHEAAEASYRRAAELLKAIPEGRDDFAPRQLLAATRDRLGKLYNDTGRFQEAAATYARGLEVIEPLIARYPTLPRLREALVNGLRSVGLIEQNHGSDEQARAALSRSLEVAERLAKDFPLRPEYRRDYARSHLNLGGFLWTRNELGGAEHHYRAAIPIYEALVAEVPGVLQYRHDLARTCSNLGLLLRAVGKTDEAEATALRAVATYEALAALAPDVPQYRSGLAVSQLNLALVLETIGQFAKAEEALRRSEEIQEALAARFPDVPDHKKGAAKALHNRAGLLANAYKGARAIALDGAAPPVAAGPRERAARAIRRAVAFARAAADRQEGERAIRRALALKGELADKFPAVPEYRMELGDSLNTLVALRPPDAEAACRRSAAIYRRLAAEDPARDGYRRMLAAVDGGLADLLAEAGRTSEAEAVLVEATDLFEALATKAPTDVDLKSYLGRTLAGRGKLRLDARDPAGARPLLERAVALQRSALEPNEKNPDVRLALHDGLTNLASAAVDQGRHAEAARLAAEAVPFAADRAEGCRDAAHLLVRCVASAESDAALPDPRRKALADDYAARAVALLRDSISPGSSALVRLESDAALAPLRSRDDYKQLVTSLQDRPGRPGN